MELSSPPPAPLGHRGHQPCVHFQDQTQVAWLLPGQGNFSRCVMAWLWNTIYPQSSCSEIFDLQHNIYIYRWGLRWPDHERTHFIKALVLWRVLKTGFLGVGPTWRRRSLHVPFESVSRLGSSFYLSLASIWGEVHHSTSFSVLRCSTSRGPRSDGASWSWTKTTETVIQTKSLLL